MIAWVEGVLRDRAPTRIVVDVQGVGYELLIPLSTFEALPDPGKTVAVHVHTHVTENNLQLFGFATSRERDVFELVLRANRVGPRLAQSILSGLAPDRLLTALAEGDVRALRGVPGVGPKMAERMSVELRERAGELRAVVARGDSHGPGASTEAEDVCEQVLSALMNLGYPKAQAERGLDLARTEEGPDASVEILLRAALRGLAR